MEEIEIEVRAYTEDIYVLDVEFLFEE